MKKKFYLLGMLAAGLTFAGCTDDIDDATGSGVASGDKGYVKIAINLPTTSGNSTRAANDNFGDGLAEEYAVEDAIIAFFKGNIDSDTEGDADFVKAMALTLTESELPSDNVTIKYSYTIDGVPTVEANEQMYAFVILNNNGLFTVSDGSLSYSSETISKFSDLQGKSYTMVDKETDVSKFITTGFLMSNAPISDRPSETTSFNPVVTTLAKVTVYENDPSKSDAIKADPIYVERAVAKVEVNVNVNGTNNNDGSITLPVKVDGDQSQNYDNHKVRFTRWALNVTNKSSKIVRDVRGYETWASYFNENVSSDIPNRFFGTVAGPYRVYWAVDNNYEEDENKKADFNHFTSDPDWKDMYNTTTSSSNYDYCFENTMDAKQQIQGFTTGVLLEGKYQIGENVDVDVFTLGASTAVYSTEEMLAYINRLLGKTDGDKYKFVVPEDEDEDGIVIGKGETEDAKIDSYQAVFKKATDNSEMSENDAKELIANASVGTINFYKKGRTYYWSRPIKHFGDYYTPIYKDKQPADYYESATDYDNENHLGRYGVVRNNWYELNIISVSGPGYPEIPEIPTDPGDPDDPGEGYVKMEVNILSWAKRTQDVEL